MLDHGVSWQRAGCHQSRMEIACETLRLACKGTLAAFVACGTWNPLRGEPNDVPRRLWRPPPGRGGKRTVLRSTQLGPARVSDKDPALGWPGPGGGPVQSYVHMSCFCCWDSTHVYHDREPG